MIRDFGPSGTLEWTNLVEGAYELETTVKDTATAEIAIATAWVELQPRLADNQPAVTPTAHPLVFVYSAPACDPARRIRVTVRDPEGKESVTPSYVCRSDRTVNLYLAGLRANTIYTAQQSLLTKDGSEPGPVIEFRTSEIPESAAARLPWQEVIQKTRDSKGVLLQSTLPPALPLAADLDGNVIWYYSSPLILTRPERGGVFFGLNRNATNPAASFLRLFDVAGTTLLETTAAAVNEQLARLGRRAISSFHHEARFLPDGRILTLANIENMMSDVQGDGELNVIGDMIIVLDRDLRVVWTWDTFDHLDVTRKATLSETCVGSGACDPYYLTPDANDWTHGNALSLTPDGNILFSMRHQDWLIKINYDNGNGDGSVMWRFGHEGDFSLDGGEATSWFSHQHDGTLFEDGLLSVFDNSNVRQAGDPTATSRGQVYRVDETTRTATLVLNKDLGEFAAAVGSAQRLPNGNFHFGSGWMPGYSAVSFEVDLEGNTVYALRAGSWEYRTHRMQDIYTPF